MSDSVFFQVSYDGPALENHEMDIKELAPALIAIADLFEEANNIINGGSSRINVNVRGSFKSGSFQIDLNVVQNVFQQILTLINSPELTGAATLTSLLGFGAKDVTIGLIVFLKRLKNRKIQKIENIENNRVRIQITRQETIDLDKRVVDLYKSPRIRAALEKIIAEPLQKNGVEEFRSTCDNNAPPVVVKKEDKEFFDLPIIGEELLGENITEAFLQIINISFREENKWRFSRGENTFFAQINDNAFLDAIDRNEIRFSKSDILRVKLKTKDILTSKGLRTEYSILEVLEHRHTEMQVPLPFKDDGPETI